MRWRTPGWFLDLVREVAPIVLDPASAEDNPTGAAQFFTPEHNGLALPWPAIGLVFVNPPYGQHLSGDVEPYRLITKKDKKTGSVWIVGFGTGWAKRMASHTGEGLYLVPCRRETEWWRELNDWCDWRCEWRSPKHGARINFEADPRDPPSKNGSTFASTIFYRGPNVRRFIRTFETHGEIEPGTRTLRSMVGKAVASGWRP